MRAPVVEFTEQGPLTREYVSAPLPEPPTATNWWEMPNVALAPLTKEMLPWVAGEIVNTGARLPSKFDSITAAVTWYVPALVGAYDEL